MRNQEERLKVVNRENWELRQKVDSYEKDGKVFESEINILKYKMGTHTKALKVAASTVRDPNRKIEEREKEFVNAGAESEELRQMVTSLQHEGEKYLNYFCLPPMPS